MVDKTKLIQKYITTIAIIICNCSFNKKETFNHEHQSIKVLAINNKIIKGTKIRAKTK